MTNTYAALLRGINVGKAKRIAMADLRAVVEGLGYGGVRTLLNSGNVVFTGTDAAQAVTAAARIEAAIKSELGVSTRVTVLSAAEIDAIVADNPLGDVADNPSRLLVSVLSDPEYQRRLEALAREDWTPEVFAVVGRAAYLWCPDGLSGGRLADAVNRALGDAATARNWATMTKLKALTDETA